MWNRYKNIEFRNCVKCKKSKNINDFFLRKHKLKDGSITIRPRSICKICNTKMGAKWKEDNPVKYQIYYEKNKPQHNKLARLRYIHIGKLGPVMPRKLYYKLWLKKTLENNPKYLDKFHDAEKLWYRNNKERVHEAQKIRMQDTDKLAYHNSALYFNSIGLSIYDVPKELIDLKVKQIKLHRLIYKQ